MTGKPTERPPRRQAAVSRFAVLLLIVVVTILLLGLIGLPLADVEATTWTKVAFTVLAAGTLLATIRITRARSSNQNRLGAAIALTALVSITAEILIDAEWIRQATGLLLVAFIAVTPIIVLKEVIDTDAVTRQTLIGAIAVYLLFGISLTFVAIAMDSFGTFFEETPRSTAYVYYAFVTITSLGYGDLVPYSDGARMVSVGFAVVSQIYLVVIVARLVSLWRPRDTASAPSEDDER